MKITKKLFVTTRPRWRKWLQTNYDKQTEIWLVRYKKTTGKPSVSYQDSVDEALCFGWIDNAEKGIDQERFATRFTPRKKVSSWSEGNVQRYRMLVRQGVMSEAGSAAFRNRKKPRN